MMTEETRYAQFDLYIKKQLDAEARHDFERRLEDDADFKQDFSAYIASLADVYKAGFQSDKRSLTEKQEQMMSRHQTKKQLGRRRLMMLAAAFVILCAMTFLLLPEDQANSEQLFTSYYTMPEVPTTLGVNQDSVLKAAYLQMNAKEFSTAFRSFEQIKKEELDAASKAEVSFFQAISALELGEGEQARNLFAAAASQRPQETSWYISMSWLKEGNIEAAKQLLEDIAQQERHYRQKQATELLRKLK